MSIRHATSEDLPLCEELCAVPELEFVGGGYATFEHLEHFLEDGYFLVDEEQGELRGLVFGEPLRANGAVLWMVAVREEHRGKGIGKALVQAYEEHCRGQGRQWMFLLGLDTDKHQRLYTTLGFNGGKRLVEYVKDL